MQQRARKTNILKVLTGSRCTDVVQLVAGAPGSDADQQLALAGRPSQNASHAGMCRLALTSRKVSLHATYATSLTHARERKVSACFRK